MFSFFFPPFCACWDLSVLHFFEELILNRSLQSWLVTIQATGNWYWNFYMAFSYRKLTAKLLWRGAECWKECQKLLNIAETIEHMRTSDLVDQDLANSSEGPLIQRRCPFSPVWWLYCTIFFITFPRITPISILREFFFSFCLKGKHLLLVELQLFVAIFTCHCNAIQKQIEIVMLFWSSVRDSFWNENHGKTGKLEHYQEQCLKNPFESESAYKCPISLLS